MCGTKGSLQYNNNNLVVKRDIIRLVLCVINYRQQVELVLQLFKWLKQFVAM